MVKIGLVVFSLVLVVLIQSTDAEGGSEAFPPVREKKWYISTLKDVVQDLAMEGILDTNALKSNVQEVDFEEAYKVAKNETAYRIAIAKDRGSTEDRLSVEDEKNVFYASLAYLLEKWGSKGLVDRNFMEKTLLKDPGLALQAKLDSQLTKAFQDGPTNADTAKTKHDL